MRLNAEEYRRAAGEKLVAALDAHNGGHYVVSHYLSGVAVECMLRAYRWRTDPSWSEKHDLRELMRKSGFLESVAARRQAEFRDLLNEMATRWSVSHRYAPSSKLEQAIRAYEGNVGSKDGALLRNSEAMVEIADRIVKYGELKWN